MLLVFRFSLFVSLFLCLSLTRFLYSFPVTETVHFYSYSDSTDMQLLEEEDDDEVVFVSDTVSADSLRVFEKSFKDYAILELGRIVDSVFPSWSSDQKQEFVMSMIQTKHFNDIMDLGKLKNFRAEDFLLEGFKKTNRESDKDLAKSKKITKKSINTGISSGRSTYVKSRPTGKDEDDDSGDADSDGVSEEKVSKNQPPNNTLVQSKKGLVMGSIPNYKKPAEKNIIKSDSAAVNYDKKRLKPKLSTLKDSLSSVASTWDTVRMSQRTSSLKEGLLSQNNTQKHIKDKDSLSSVSATVDTSRVDKMISLIKGGGLSQHSTEQHTYDSTNVNEDKHYSKTKTKNGAGGVVNLTEGKIFTRRGLLKSVDLVKFKEQYSNKYITSGYIKNIINSLGSSVFQGRATGERGQVMCASFLNYELEHIGCVSPYHTSFFQLFKVLHQRIKEADLRCNGSKFIYGKDYYFDLLEDIPKKTNYNLIFVGKIDSISMVEQCERYYKDSDNNAFLVTPDNDFSIRALYKEIGKLPARYKINLLVLLNNDRLEAERRNVENRLENRDYYKVVIANSTYNSNFIPTLYVNTRFVMESFGAELSAMKLKHYLNNKSNHLELKNIKPKYLALKISFYNGKENVANLVALNKHYDPSKENIIICANYDGVKWSKSDNYNASGVAAVLSIAKLFSHVSDSYDLKKNLIFVFMVGKNSSNIGSKLYTFFPAISHNKTFLVINIDGLGMHTNKHKGRVLYTYNSTKNVTNFEDFINSMNYKSGPFKLDKSLNKNKPHIYNSDAYQFEKLNLPFIEFSDMNISPDRKHYLNSARKVDFNAITKRVRYISEFIWNVANSSVKSTYFFNKTQLYQAVKKHNK